MNWPKLSLVIFSNADPGACVRILTDCERLEHDDLEFEVILVLDGLSDKVEAMLNAYHFSFELRFASAETAINRAKGRNLGVEVAKNEIILFLDSDLEISPGLLYRHSEAFEAPETMAVMGEIFMPEFVKKNRWYRFLDSDYRSTRRWASRSGNRTSPPLRYVNTANFSVRREAYLSVGGHRESIDHPEAEDIDLAFRLSSLGENVIVYQPEALAYCLHPPLRASLESKYEFGKEGIPKLLDHYPELYSVLPSRFVKMPGHTPTSQITRGMMSLLFTPPFFFIARGLRLLSPDLIAFRMMRYMLQYESVRGVKGRL